MKSQPGGRRGRHRRALCVQGQGEEAGGRNMSAVLAQSRCDAPTVMEFFSRGRFQDLAEQCGMVGRGASDLSEGWGWRRKEDRTRAEQEITIVDPDFSVFSPPCGPLSLMPNLTPDDRRSDPKGQLEVKLAKD